MIFLTIPYLAQAPEITNDATIGQVVVQPTATPTSTPTATSESGSTATASPSSTPRPTATASQEPQASSIPRRFRQNALTIYGYGPVNAEVSLKGFGVSEKTVSDSNGLFMFSEIYSFTYTYPELCIQATDENNRTTQPSCIPGLPNDSLIPLEVGPILLSPTISISENRVQTDSLSVMSGKTIPDSKVNVFIAKKDSFDSKLTLVKNAHAYSLPILETKADDKGYFEVSLPTGESANYKIFASAKYGEDLSAKSNTLTFTVLTQVKTLLQNIIDFIIRNKMMAVALLEVLVFIILFALALKSTTKRKKRHFESDYLEFVETI